MKEKISIKTPAEIVIMRESGKIAAKVLNKIAKMVIPGITTDELNNVAEKDIISAGGFPSFKNFNGYPKAICVSINSQVVHGIPGKYIIKSGDIVGIDLGVKYKGFHSDTAVTVGVGGIDKNAQTLINTAKLALDNAISVISPDIHLGDVQEVIQKTIEDKGFSVIRDLAGHGIGRNLQESPSITNFGKCGSGPVLKEGMTFAIEPMLSAGSHNIRVLDDGWTVVTADNSLSSHFEHTIVITSNGSKVLTNE